MSYNVYLVEYVGTPRNHQAFYVEFGPGQRGKMYHVKGAIERRGMQLEVREDISRPGMGTTNNFLALNFLGTLREENVELFEQVIESVPPPAQQFNRQGPIPGMRRRRCQEWVQEVLEELEHQQVLE